MPVQAALRGWQGRRAAAARVSGCGEMAACEEGAEMQMGTPTRRDSRRRLRRESPRTAGDSRGRRRGHREDAAFAAFRARHVQAVRARDAGELRWQGRWVAEGGRLVEGGAVAFPSGRLQAGHMGREDIMPAWEKPKDLAHEK